MLKKTVYSIYRFFLLFALVAFVTSSNMMLFLYKFSSNSDIVFTEKNITTAAVFTFCNAIFLGFILTIIDFIRRKIIVEKPVKIIQGFTQKITHGDFSVRIKPMHIGEYNKIVADLNKMTEELSSIETLRTDFVSNVSHELKTPLSVLQNYGALLEEPNLTEEKRIEYAKSINRVTSHLSELISNILRLSKLESQKLDPNLKKCNLSEMLCECLIGYESEWEKKNIEIESDIESDVYIDTDPEMLLIVWSNLFSNALKFTPDGGKISVSLNRDDRGISVSVSDTGCGMDENTIKHIFDKFYQGDTSHSVRGNGLGLAIVKKVIDLLNAEISVESTPGVGSKFTVRL
ncbi:MAG: HAMP domain-containing sensor histidine kinase [Oscillospiraceae bacterium]|nr:HAMP domain-containing sensor histidine kinase [Oscillospiraceae bacterium]